ncbi:MAG: rhomboid family intramembrane serine protease [Desulfovibrio sp.]|nr:MAG: rhomboid family intramembrane serine protease [Desulfovibrio sp.]
MANMRFSQTLVYAAGAVAFLWLVHMALWVLPLEPGDLGIMPRAARGLRGIILAPFAHADLAHLAANSGPLFVLLAAALLLDTGRTIAATVLIIVVGGALVWIFGGDGSHIGASGVVFGLAGFLGLYGILRRSILSLAVSVGVVVVYGSMLVMLFRNQAGVSWSSHFFGFAAGLGAAWLLGKVFRADVSGGE